MELGDMISERSFGGHDGQEVEDLMGRQDLGAV